MAELLVNEAEVVKIEEDNRNLLAFLEEASGCLLDVVSSP